MRSKSETLQCPELPKESDPSWRLGHRTVAAIMDSIDELYRAERDPIDALVRCSVRDGRPVVVAWTAARAEGLRERARGADYLDHATIYWGRFAGDIWIVRLERK